MEKILLLTTPVSFGELIQQSLEETSRYQVSFVSTGVEAIENSDRARFGLAILDAEVEDVPTSELLGALKAACPDIKFILIPLENRAGDPLLSSMRIHDYLMKPFYLPDLLEMVDRALPGKVEEAAPTPKVKKTADELPGIENPKILPTWLDDRTKTAQYLTSLALESAVQGILVLRGTDLWAFAGQISQPAAEEVVQVVSNYAISTKSGLQGKKPDLTRFIRLGSTGGEYLLFSTSLCANMVLTLLFDAETPFSQIRTQVYQMVHLINSPDRVIRAKDSSKTTLPRLEAFAPQPVPHLMSNKRIGVDEKSESGFMTPLLEDVPSSMPKSEKKSQVAVKQNEQSLEKQKTVKPLPEAASLVARPATKEFLGREDRKQSSLPVVFDLSYFCILIPRMPYHKLSGDLAVRLAEWLGQLCMAYGWRLEHLSVHPDYMQWVVNVVPTVVPEHLMDTLRGQISERIFTIFPQLRNDNPSGDFWAPGYLILTRYEQLSDQMVQDFIRQVRQYQGAPSADL